LKTEGNFIYSIGNNRTKNKIHLGGQETLTDIGFKVNKVTDAGVSDKE
jgi:hypothetical protein